MKRFTPALLPLLVCCAFGLFSGCGSEETGGPLSCSSDLDCDDGNPCTNDSCANSSCASVIVFELACDDGNPCTENTKCNVDGFCRGGNEVVSNGDPCQSCVCSPDGGLTCVYMEVGSSCDDDDCCTTNDLCGACDPKVQGCVEGQTVCGGDSTDCADDNECTQDLCTCDGDEATCSNDNLTDGMPCSYSENDCTEGDLCVAGQCTSGPPRDLDDKNPCTTDLCVKGEVVHEPITAELGDLPCDDGNQCTTSDSCFLGSCVGQEEVLCDTPTCAAAATCVNGEGCVPSWLPEGAICDDGNTCTGGDHCNAEHECVAKWNYEYLESLPQGTDMDDNDPCTKDFCEDGTIYHTPITGGACTDDNLCTENDLCASGVCVGTAKDCADDFTCTVDTCETDGTCASSPDDSGCDDANICTDDSCSASAGCVHTYMADPCADPEHVCCVPQCDDAVLLPDGTCCPADGFCPEEDTTLSGSLEFSVVYIPEGVTVTCTGDAPLKLSVLGTVWINGVLSADGADALDGYSGSAPLGACGGYGGGDGNRMNMMGPTSIIDGAGCTTDAASNATCELSITEKESYSGQACAYLARAPGGPGYGPGGGWGGDMAMMLFGGLYGGAAGGGGGSFSDQGTGGEMSSNSCTILNGGAAGGTYAWDEQGGSGGGGGGRGRNGACGACTGGGTGVGGHGGAGGGYIEIRAGYTHDVFLNGTITARGGKGSGGIGPQGPTGGTCDQQADCTEEEICLGAVSGITGNCYAICEKDSDCPGEATCTGDFCQKPLVCTGGGGGGSGGGIYIQAKKVIAPAGIGASMLVPGGDGGPAFCSPGGAGGKGGEGYTQTDVFE